MNILNRLNTAVQRRAEIEDRSGFMDTLFGSEELTAAETEVDAAKFEVLTSLEDTMSNHMATIASNKVRIEEIGSEIYHLREELGIFRFLKKDTRIVDLKDERCDLNQESNRLESETIEIQRVIDDVNGSSWIDLAVGVVGLVGVAALAYTVLKSGDSEGALEAASEGIFGVTHSGYAENMPGRIDIHKVGT